MFKMGRSMARKILAPGSSSAATSTSGPANADAQGQQQQQQNNTTANNNSNNNNNTGSKTSKANEQLRGKTGDELNDFSKLEQDPRLPLNVRQIFKITKSWKAIARTMSRTGTAMFLNLFEQNQDLFYLFDRFQHLKGKELHESMELREHAATVMSTLDQSINLLSDYDNFVAYLHSIGQLHRKIPGFKREHFWKIEQPFLKAVKQTLDERCNETIEEIYKIAIKLIIETIAEGYGQDKDEGQPLELEQQDFGGPAGGAGPGGRDNPSGNNDGANENNRNNTNTTSGPTNGSASVSGKPNNGGSSSSTNSKTTLSSYSGGKTPNDSVGCDETLTSATTMGLASVSNSVREHTDEHSGLFGWASKRESTFSEMSRQQQPQQQQQKKTKTNKNTNTRKVSGRLHDTLANGAHCETTTTTTTTATNSISCPYNNNDNNKQRLLLLEQTNNLIEQRIRSLDSPELKVGGVTSGSRGAGLRDTLLLALATRSRSLGDKTTTLAKKTTTTTRHHTTGDSGNQVGPPVCRDSNSLLAPSSSPPPSRGRDVIESGGEQPDWVGAVVALSGRDSLIDEGRKQSGEQVICASNKNDNDKVARRRHWSRTKAATTRAKQIDHKLAQSKHVGGGIRFRSFARHSETPTGKRDSSALGRVLEIKWTAPRQRLIRFIKARSSPPRIVEEKHANGYEGGQEREAAANSPPMSQCLVREKRMIINYQTEGGDNFGQPPLATLAGHENGHHFNQQSKDSSKSMCPVGDMSQERQQQQQQQLAPSVSDQTDDSQPVAAPNDRRGRQCPRLRVGCPLGSSNGLDHPEHSVNSNNFGQDNPTAIGPSLMDGDVHKSLNEPLTTDNNSSSSSYNNNNNNTNEDRASGRDVDKLLQLDEFSRMLALINKLILALDSSKSTRPWIEASTTDPPRLQLQLGNHRANGDQDTLQLVHRQQQQIATTPA